MKTTLDFFFDKEDTWDCNYNNQDFFECRQERLRWCLVSADFLGDNPYYGCVDLDTLEIKNQTLFDELALVDQQTVYENEWDWMGDDFDHMEAYLSFIMKHDPSFYYWVSYENNDEYLRIVTWEIPKKYQTDPMLRQAYIDGVERISGDYYMDSESYTNY